MGAVVGEALHIDDSDMTVAAETLAALVTPARLELKCMYPNLKDIRTVSMKIGAAVANNIIRSGRSRRYPGTTKEEELPSLSDLERLCKETMYVPSYHH